MAQQESIKSIIDFYLSTARARMCKRVPFCDRLHRFNKQKEYGNFLKVLAEIEVIFKHLRALEYAGTKGNPFVKLAASKIRDTAKILIKKK